MIKKTIMTFKEGSAYIHYNTVTGQIMYMKYFQVNDPIECKRKLEKIVNSNKI